ncbi:uncharacterized protein LOC129584540 [Paramacrobiotus metropolitanus]|uniref:uncharacterized protein LOC129584540 n=1 Tax=Paramacrobiotus metropolitanus TaxID=2943436 RepID=UPI0024464ABA|nr:uncharacterized protein LOC129584540 [Paramacrobiotus metropolitanus]
MKGTGGLLSAQRRLQALFIGLITILSWCDASQTRLPREFLQVFRSGADAIDHVRAVRSVFDIPDNIISSSTGSSFEFLSKDASSKHPYEYCLTLQNAAKPLNFFHRCIPFALNAKVTLTNSNIKEQVTFTMVNTSLHAAIQSHPAGGITETGIVFTPKEEGMDVSVNGQPAPFYQLAVRWYILGAFQIDPDECILDKMDLVNRSLNGAFSFSNKSVMSVTQMANHKPNQFAISYAYGPAIPSGVQLVEHHYGVYLTGALYTLSGLDFNATMDESTPLSTHITIDMRAPETTPPKQRVLETFNWQWNTITQNITVNNETVTLVYKRTVPWPYHGTFEEIRTNVTTAPSGAFRFLDTDAKNDTCATPRHLRIFKQPASRDVVMTEESCRNTSLRIRIGEIVEQSLHSEKGIILTTAAMGVNGELTFTMIARSHMQNGSDGQLSRNRTIRMSLDPSTPLPTLNVMCADHVLIDGQWREHQHSAQFRRVVSPLVLRRLRNINSSVAEPPFVQEIRQIADQQFQMTYEGSGVLRVHRFAFNTPTRQDRAAPQQMSMSTYLEVYGNPIWTEYTVRPVNGSFDLSVARLEKDRVQIFHQEGAQRFWCSLFLYTRCYEDSGLVVESHESG